MFYYRLRGLLNLKKQNDSGSVKIHWLLFLHWNIHWLWPLQVRTGSWVTVNALFQTIMLPVC